MEERLVELMHFMEELQGTDATGHGDDHVHRAVKLAVHILATEPDADEFVTLAAIILHDTYDEKLVDNQAAAKQIVRDKLIDLSISEDDRETIFLIIDNMSWSKERFGNPEPLPLEGKIVQDADRLEAMGLTGVVRTMQYGIPRGHVIYDPSMPPRELKTKADYRSDEGETIINHFYEKLLLLPGSLNTHEGKRIGAKRDAAMRAFIDQYLAEWHNADY